MEAAAAGVVASGGARPSTSSPSPAMQPGRKPWRAVSASGEEMDRSKLGQSDERNMYEQGSGAIEVDFCSVDAEILQQRYRDVARQRDELQHVETELRAQIMAQGEILEMRRSFGAQLSEHVTASAELKDQLQEKDKRIRELERKLDDKERELHMIKIDNEAAWAKENLLREQDRELASYRIDRDNMDAERANHVKKIRELNEHIHEKETRIIEFEEQRRVVQEAILYKDERIRDAEAWIARVQEMDAMQSTANQSLQAELRERTEQINQLWMGWQRQVIEMERLHVQTVQKLRIELGDVRERSGLHSDDSRVRRTNSGEASLPAENEGDHFIGNDKVSHNDSFTIQPNGHIDHSHGLVSAGVNTSQIEYVPGVPLLSTSLLGVGGVHPSGPMAGLHSYVIPQSPTRGHIPLSHMGHYSTVPAVLSQQYWTNQQAVADVSQKSHESEYQHSEIDENIVSAGASNCELSEALMNSQHPESEPAGYVETQMSTHGQTIYQVTAPSEPQEVERKRKIESNVSLTNSPQMEDFVPETPTPGNNHEMSPGSRQGSSSVSDSVTSDGPVTGQGKNTGNGRAQAPVLLDERSLLACIVRSIPAGSGGQIRISTTLPNRLGKMLAPLHWHDYRKHYGKLDELMARHPELFIIEGDFVHLRDGAQTIVSATTAAAKMAAAAAVWSPYSSLIPSVAITPVAPHHRQTLSGSNQSEASEKLLPDQHSNGPISSGSQNSNVKILNKSKDIQGQNGLPLEISSNHTTVHGAAASNSSSRRRARAKSSQKRLSGNGNQGSRANIIAALTPRR